MPNNQNNLACPLCQSDSTMKYGTRDGIQRYKCKQCNHTFTGNAPGRPKDDDEIAIRMPVRFWQTLRAIANARGLTPSKYLQDILVREFEEQKE